MNLFKNNAIKVIRLEKQAASEATSFKENGVCVYPVTWGDLDNKKIIQQLKSWRSENQNAFLRVFNVTIAGTLSWLKKGVLEREDRLLFLVNDIYGETIGHVGISSFNFEKKTCEIDNIVRGKVSSQSKVMESAVKGLLTWIFEKIEPECIELRVFNFNTKALALYYRLGFQLDALYPLEKTAKGDEIEWIDSDNKIDGFFISMKLTKENYVAL